MCAAEMSGFEVNGEGMSVHNEVCGSATLWKLYASNNLVQELRLDDARFHTTPCAPKLVRSVAIFSFFLVVFVVMETTRHSLVIGQLSKRRLT